MNVALERATPRRRLPVPAGAAGSEQDLGEPGMPESPRCQMAGLAANVCH